MRAGSSVAVVGAGLGGLAAACVSAARAAHWRALGFDRASVGVQSLDDATLQRLEEDLALLIARLGTDGVFHTGETA